MTDARDIVEDLRRHAFDDCGGFAKIVETHVAYEAAREIISLRKQLEDAREVITEANNSLYGSQGYFLSLDGGPPNKYHLAEGIERLKSNAKALRSLPTDDGWEDIATLKAENERLRDEIDKLVTAIKFEAPAIRDGVDVEKRCRILMDCAREAKPRKLAVDTSPRTRWA